jgi:tRNA dimethylallyltransferase
MEGTVPVFILFGPTASGKTDILFRLFGKDGPFPLIAEIICADSMQVYRGMDIGTAKPSTEEREQLPHHLIDIRDPSEQFNVGDFTRLAGELAADIAGRGKLPVISGGTGFYLKNFIYGLPESPPSDAAIRAELKLELKEKGPAALMAELARCDPVSAERIHLNDEYRLLRALEVLRLSGQPLSSYNVTGAGTKGGFNSNCRFLVIGISRPREELYRRINERCAAMFSHGLVGEVRKLYDAGYSPRDPGLRAIGYREFFVEDPPGLFRLSQDLSGVQALIAQNSRRYAKRQITYFNSLPAAKWIKAAKDDAETSRLLQAELEKFMGPKEIIQ